MKLNTILSILQQSEYDIPRTMAWIKAHSENQPDLTPEKWTVKLRLIQFFMKLFFFLILEVRLRLALLIVAGPELVVRKITYSRAKRKLTALQAQGLKTVAIAGSYGKTSTKHILKHALNSQIKTVATDKSVNTILGVSQFIMSQVKADDQLCIFEFGEFKPGDLEKLTALIEPEYGILTPIGRQHVERFGSVEGLVQEFTSFTNYFMTKPDHLLSAEENIASFPQFPSYGNRDDKNTYAYHDVMVSTGGTDFRAYTAQTDLDCFIPLLGEHQAKNCLPTFWIAEQLHLNLDEVKKSLKSLPFVPHRHEPNFIHDGIVLLDNGYNSNPDSAVASLELLKQLRSPQKVVITMGFVELGDQAQAAHTEFGRQIAQVADVIGVVDTPNSQAMIDGFTALSSTKVVVTGSSPVEVWKKIQPMIKPNALVLFENGYQEQYS